MNFAAVPTPSFTPAPPPPAIVVTVPSTHQGTPGEARGVGAALGVALGEAEQAARLSARSLQLVCSAMKSAPLGAW